MFFESHEADGPFDNQINNYYRYMECPANVGDREDYSNGYGNMKIQLGDTQN